MPDPTQTEAALQALLGGRIENARNMLDHVPPIETRGGLRFSMQASRFHYCQPRANTGPWTHVELGFPNRVVPKLKEYAEGGPPTKTIYGYVPLSVLAAVVDRFGGLKPQVEAA